MSTASNDGLNYLSPLARAPTKYSFCRKRVFGRRRDVYHMCIDYAMCADGLQV